MSTYKIRIFSSFCSSTTCKTNYENLCQIATIKNYGEKIYITDQDDYTHVLILNTAMPDIRHIPKKNIVGLAFEPFVFLNLTPEFINYAKNYIGKYFIGDEKNLGYPFIERFSYMWHAPLLNNIPVKKNIMSIMCGDKLYIDGHKYRHSLVGKILNSKLPIDIYGRGCKFYSNDPRLKGEFIEYEPYETYQYHICIENSQSNDYFSEKLMNPLICSTIPVYLGCKHIDSYFPNSVITLSGNCDTDFTLLTEICNTPDNFLKPIDVEKVKNTISLLKNLDSIFS